MSPAPTVAPAADRRAQLLGRVAIVLALILASPILLAMFVARLRGTR